MRVGLSPRIQLRTPRVTDADADRQHATASEILRRFETQPGVILADEVGMGKTFVALAVATSVIEATQGRQQVVIKVPNGVRDKWPRDWRFFSERCRTSGIPIRATEVSHGNTTSFLKLLDDPPERRHHILFITHNALTGSLADPWAKLAIISRAFVRYRRLARQREIFARWAGRIIQQGTFGREDLVEELLYKSPKFWKSIYERYTGDVLDDDPVPDALIEASDQVSLEGLAEVLDELPLKSSESLEERLTTARQQVRDAMTGIWEACRKQLDLHLPLLILDEAHHLKNPDTRLAGILSNSRDGHEERGPLGGVFDRMLFLTATPFQLGHHELIQILHRFDGVRWKSATDRRFYAETVKELEIRLDDAQTAALRLDRLWGRLRPEDMGTPELAEWWRDPGRDAPVDRLTQVRQQAAETERRIRLSEEALRPWVIRHSRPDRESRRDYRPGRSIVLDVLERRGLEVDGPAVFPFLLAARAQAVVLAEERAERRNQTAIFADGLASSYEAFRETRKRRLAERGVLRDDVAPVSESGLSNEVRWYLDHIEAALPESDRDAWGRHPKIAATCGRALKLWMRGEKVVIFCFYRATGRALRLHLSRLLDAEIMHRAAALLGDSDASSETLRSDLERISDRFFDSDTRIARAARQAVSATFEGAGLTVEETDRFTAVVLRFLRTPSFLVRYLDLTQDDPAADFMRIYSEGTPGQAPLERQVERFALFILERTASEREELATALDSIQTGKIYARSKQRDDPDEDDTSGPLLPNVRLVNGTTEMKTRQHLMLAFNSPFFPEILIASSVMAEGVDLHLNCRHVIHHDLDWNPSTLEQRTGRLDRMGCKAEHVGEPIIVYEPFIEATQDEKQFLVVKDRERWFNVVMGQKMAMDEWSTERTASRVELPRSAAERLTMRLELPGK